MPKPKLFLSKTKYLDGSKCSKLLWYEFNKKAAVPKPDAETQAIFDQGSRVGELAQKLFPDGIKLARQQMPEKMHAHSMEAIKLRKPLFESGLIFGRAYALPDILVPVGKDAWDLIEVKSGSGVKEEHYLDVAFQKYVYAGAGLKIRKCFLMHINSQYLRRGEIDLKKLFHKVDITAEIKPYQISLERSIQNLLEVIAGREPKIKIGPRCGKPHACPLMEHCWSFLPKGDIFELRGRKDRLFELLDQGILKIKDIPLEGWLSGKQLIQIQSHRTGKAHVEEAGIQEFLGGLSYPLYFLDFETLSSAIPPYDLTHPFENIFFQFSLHVIEKAGAKPIHYGCLAPGDVDPRPEILKRLKSLLGDKGTIIAYSMGFEIGCLKNAAEAYPRYKSWFKKLPERFVDLLVPFKNFYYYHPAQEGSCSIKNVLPAMTKKSYKGMTIADGGVASLEYARVTFGNNIAPKDRQRVRQALEDYCKLDTQAMVDVLAGLKRL